MSNMLVLITAFFCLFFIGLGFYFVKAGNKITKMVGWVYVTVGTIAFLFYFFTMRL